MAINVDQIDTIIDVTLEEFFGTGISSVVQTTQSDEPGGVNVWTVTLTNGQKTNFFVMNGYATGTQIAESVNEWFNNHSATTMTFAYVEDETLYIQTNITDGNGESY